jgi:hypothetical protein
MRQAQRKQSTVGALRVGCRVGALAAAAVTAGGCAYVPIPIGSGAREVTIAEFAQPEPAEAEGELAEAAADAGADAIQPVAAQAMPGVVGADLADMLEDVDFSDRTVLRPTRPGEKVIVDSLVGHVNGRPVFADDFLEPIEDRLMRAAEESSGVQRDHEFRAIINEWLRDVVTNELLLAEAEASLSAQEQRGLVAWLRMMYDEEIRRGGGTRSGAEQRRRRSGEGLDQYLGEQKDMVLIHQLLERKVHPRVIVSWRDVEREYQRLYDDLNPPPTVALARIRLNSATQAAQVEDVSRRLAAGESFTGIAEELGFADGGLWETFEMGSEGIADIEVSEVMRQALQGLDEGDTSEPLALGSSTVWLHVVEVNRPVTRSIYDPDVQLILRNRIERRRNEAEWFRYVSSLLRRGVYDDLDEMADRLYRIAIVRYGR